MPRPSRQPILIDQEKTLTSGYLSKMGYLKLNHRIEGYTGWVSNKTMDLDIRINSIMEEGDERVILNYYDFNSEKVEQVIYLTSKPSNLGNGSVWFFICPFSGKRCRNLIFINNRFMHRSNLLNAMYSKQVESKYWRKMFQLQSNIPETERILNEPRSKHYKKYYNGKITKRFKKYLETLKKWNDNRAERMELINQKVKL